MGAFAVTRSAWKKALLAVFVLYLYGLLGYLGVSHRHQSEASHPDCQLCQISSQPSLAQAPEALPTLLPIAFDFVPRASEAVLAPRRAPFLSRGPPA
jgi:hypothetical protein